MATRLYVRTGNTGTDPSVDVDDLGLTVPTASGWLLISASDPDQAINSPADDGQFNARRLRDSQDLYDAITTSGLEWSKTGILGERADAYIADYMILQDLIGDDWDLTDGRLTSPQASSLPAETRLGEFFYDTTTNQLYIGNGTSWEAVEMGTTPLVLLLDEVNPGKLTYVGEATPGTATSAASWRIYRLDESGGGDEELIKLYANSSTSFDQVWDDRLSLTYNLPA